MLPIKVIQTSHFHRNIRGICWVVMTKRFELGTLTPLFPLHDNLHVDTTRIMPLVRVFRTYRNAVSKLRREYQGLTSPTEGLLDPNGADFPYPNSYEGKSGRQVDFTYDQRLTKNKLIFMENVSPSSSLISMVKMLIVRALTQVSHRVFMLWWENQVAVSWW